MAREKAIAIEEEDWVDSGWGGIVSCEAVPYSDNWPYDKGTCVPDRNPWEAMCTFDVVYANGSNARITARGWEVLEGLGFRGVTVNGEAFEKEDGRFFDIGLMALVSKALAECSPIQSGRVSGLGDADAGKVLSKYGILPYPTIYDEGRDAEIFARWKKEWLDSGMCVNDEKGHGLCVSKMLLEEEMLRSFR